MFFFFHETSLLIYGAMFLVWEKKKGVRFYEKMFAFLLSEVAVWFGFRLFCFFFCVVVFGQRFVTTLLVFEAVFQVWLAFHWLLGCGSSWL